MACDATAYLGGQRAAKSPRGTEPLALGVSQDPLRQATCGTMMAVDHGRRFRPAEEAAMVLSRFDLF